jgi:hypothetical protein
MSRTSIISSVDDPKKNCTYSLSFNHHVNDVKEKNDVEIFYIIFEEKKM